MRNFFILVCIALIIGLAMHKGASLQRRAPPAATAAPAREDAVPSIGRVQVLNGCGSGGSARIIADYLRDNNFDVKNIGNAENWNYPQTLVIARVGDTAIAARVAAALDTKNMVLIRTPENLYDVTVIVGPDYRERIQ